MEWLHSLGIVFAPYHGFVLEGNECSKVLSKVDQLEQELPEHLKQYARFLRSFKVVQESCLGLQVKATWAIDVALMRCEFLSLQELNQMSKTPKLHIIFQHVPDYIRLSGKGLGEGSEQGLESSHSAFKKVWSR